jgi:hypothetical protein
MGEARKRGTRGGAGLRLSGRRHLLDFLLVRTTRALLLPIENPYNTFTCRRNRVPSIREVDCIYMEANHLNDLLFCK